MKNILNFLLIPAFIFLMNCCSTNKTDDLYDVFLDPPANARPFVRWWWNGNSITENEVLRELDVMRKAGIGGVEINPIRMPLEQDSEKFPSLRWISPEWNHIVKSASERAKENDMLVDLIVGSGWPFGGEFLESGEIVQRVLTNQKELTGPSQFIVEARDLINEVPQGYSKEEFKDVLKSKILFIRLIPEELNNIDECLNFDSKIRDRGNILIDVPEGKYRLIAGIWQEGHVRVTFGAPGSDGPVLDHLNSGAVRKYLDRLSEALEKEFGDELGAYLRALFCDSIELAGANWTTDFSKKFYDYCGYELEPFLPFVFYKPWVGYKDDLSLSSDFSVQLQKVRYDYNKVLVETFLENFTMTFKNWCNEHGALCRYQAYGLPWLVGLSEGYMIPDIPESNSWLNRERYFPKSEYNIWSKYASSSGHIMGNPIISCEAMSNLDGVFKTTLEQIKQADDMNFIAGITHSVLHGYNYSPPEAGFPGWIRFGTYFNEQNTWWPYFRKWSDYNSRLSAVFQASKPAAEIAILGPTADVWSNHGLKRDEFHNTPWYCYQLWKSFSQHGFSVDYVNETIIQNSKFDEGQLELGKMKYQILILTDIESILPATAKSIAEYANAGGKIVFIGKLPSRSPSMVGAGESDNIVKDLIHMAVSDNEGAILIDGPGSMDDLISWTSDLIEKTRVKSPLRIKNPQNYVFQTHYRYSDQDIVFFCNQDKENAVEFVAEFDRSKGFPWVWNPETGERSIYNFGSNPKEFSVDLDPLESLLIVFENKKGAGPESFEIDETEDNTINALWNIKFLPHNGPDFQIDLDHLPDLAMSEDDRLNSFAGKIVYKTNLNLENTDVTLDLGKVYGISDVFLNDESLGSKWYGKHRYPLEGIAKIGNNKLEIILTTTLYNYCRTREDNPEIERWLKTKDPEPTGMSGPVRIFTHKHYQSDSLLLDKPEHGYVSNLPAGKWEEAMLTGNGTLGALVMGYPLRERIIFSHEKLFLPENPPTLAPDFGSSMDKIRELVLKGDTEKASELSLKLGSDVDLGEYYWTDPFIPACQMEIEVLDKNPLTNYSRSVNYETGEATIAWSTKKGHYNRSVFSSRSDGVICTRYVKKEGKPSNFRIRLAQLPFDEAKSENDQEFQRDEVIKDLIYKVDKEGIFKYTTLFRKQWAGSLKGYTVETRIVDYDGEMHTDGEWIYLNDCRDLTLLTDISLSYDFPVSAETGLESAEVIEYDKLLDRHSAIQGEMFNRFSLSLGNTKDNYQTPDQLISSSSFGNLNRELVTELCEAARYIVISSSGKIPPTLVGIWGGTWKPEWSGDFTHNGNVPSIIAGGLNTNFPEIIEAYTDYMWSMMDDFRDNARDIYGAPGIFVPSRSSDSGKTYHYGSWHPHLFWFSGGAWAAQIFYDYWQYTGDNQFLEEKAIPFMLEAVDFLEFIITEDEDGRFMFLPSYSPEVGPKKENFEGHDMLAINATMDIASLKQLLRNLLKLVDCGLLESDKVKVWENILHRLPDYGIDESGDLKEWIWPGFENNNKHRHASHLYPLFYEPDPEFLSNSELIKAASTAIENRLSYRRDKNGAEMAFGLVQMGLAAAHINDVEHAYECVDWLCNSYWSPAFTAYHDPGKIFNVDICGGLPAVITEMLVQSSSDKIILLPALPHQWPEGEVKGVGTRCGVILDLSWENSKPKSAVLHAQRNTSLSMQYMGRTWKFELEAGQTVVTRLNMPPDFWDEIPESPSTTMPGQIKDDYWYSQFQRVNQEVANANDTEIVFFGNSITWMWSLGSATGHDVWTKNYSAYKPLNMGNSGDITPVMLYRLTHGNLDFAGGHQPRVAVLLCGTNNFVVTQSAGGDVKWDLGIDCPPEDVANGVRAVAQVFRRRLPQTRVIMMGILPVSDKTKWAKCQQVNSINAALSCNENEVAFIDLQDKFLQPDGSIIRELFTDGTHLTAEGYKVWAKNLDKLVREMMKAEPLDPVKIMLIGGSITEGANSDESYRRYLDGMLRREGILIDFVGSRKKHKDNQTEPDNYQYDIDHEGHWGKTSNWLAKNMPEIIDNNVPDVAVIHTGIEDIISGSDSAGPLTDDIIDNISTVVKSLRSKNKSVKIVLANILPIQGHPEAVKLLNDKISSYIKANSTARSPVLMADLQTGFDPLADFTDDCVMPNASGARKMAEVIAEMMKIWRL